MSEKKKNPLFEILGFICTKKYTWNEMPEEYRAVYSQFPLNRFLSSYEYLLPLLNELTTKKFTNEQHYMTLYTWVKKTKHYFNYDAYRVESNIDNDLCIAIKKEYGIGNREAKRYNEMLNEGQRKYLKNKWADYIKFVYNKKP
jgi:hypothetical protein